MVLNAYFVFLLFFWYVESLDNMNRDISCSTDGPALQTDPARFALLLGPLINKKKREGNSKTQCNAPVPS